MRNIEPEIMKYIDKSIEKASKMADKAVIDAENRFAVRTERYMKELRDGFQQDIKMGFEAADLHMRVIAREMTVKAIREEVPGIVRKELKMFLTPA